MPVYQYECKKCHAKVYTEKPMAEADNPETCGDCHSTMQRIYNFGSVTFNGSGFYRTDK